MDMYINKLASRSYNYIHLKSSHICVIHLVLERCCFEVVLSKKRLNTLGINLGIVHLQPIHPSVIGCSNGCSDTHGYTFHKLCGTHFTGKFCHCHLLLLLFGTKHLIVSITLSFIEESPTHQMMITIVFKSPGPTPKLTGSEFGRRNGG